ncbi:MAG: MotA/TolQ/ExbB proton channel family protein [Oceanococcus sp.]
MDIGIISLRVSLQQRDLTQAKSGNALGRLLITYKDNVALDPETLEMRLHDRVQKESGRVHRFGVFLAIIAAVAPLMGLLGTVVGMINTFQAITLYGTGDPQTMAGGISQALITTVLGLVVAVPAVLLHALVKARATSVVNMLKAQSASLTADGMQVHAASSPNQSAADLAAAPA